MVLVKNLKMLTWRIRLRHTDCYIIILIRIIKLSEVNPLRNKTVCEEMLTMKTVSAHCPNCGAPIDLDPDNIAKFCAQCGSKIMLDVETIQQLLIEKEKTKQVEAKERSKTRQAEMEYKKASSSGVLIVVIILAMLLFMAAIFALIVINFGKG